MNKKLSIGRALKLLRLQNHLTQTEMADGIMSESYYSKIERDVHQIDASTLIELLRAHNFYVEEFFKILTDQTSLTARYTDIEYHFSKGQSKKEIKELSNISNQVKDWKDIPSYADLKRNDASAWASPTHLHISKSKLKKIRVLLLKNTADDPYYSKILGQVLPLLSTEETYFYVNRAFDSYINNPIKDPETIHNLGRLCIIFLNHGWATKIPYKQMVYVNEFIRKVLPNDPSIGLEKIIANYYNCLLHNNTGKAQKIINLLYDSDYLYLIKDTLK